MRHRNWLILISVIALGCVGGSVSVSQPVYAIRKRSAQVRRRAPHYHNNSTKKSRRVNAIRIPSGVYPKDLLYYTQNGRIGYTRYYLHRPHYQTNMSKSYIKAVVSNEFRNINGARHGIRERSVIRNSTLDRLANWRAQQAHQRFTHYNKKGQPLAWLDAEKMRLGSYRYNRRNIGENMFYVGKLSQVQTNNGVAGYYFKEPEALAGDNVFDSLNNDAASQWAHGENIMMPQHRYVGIGTYYQRSNHTLYVLVEFSSKKPIVHKR